MTGRGVVLLEDRFVHGVISKTLLLGLTAAAIAFFAHSLPLAGAIAIGALIAVINLRVLAWTTKQMLDFGENGRGSAGAWTVVLFGKTLVLFGIIWFLVVALGVDIVGFVLGFSSFLPAIGWQTLTGRPEEDDIERD